MRGYGQDGHTTIEKIEGLGVYYICTEMNFFKVYSLHPITITELRDPSALKSDPNTLTTKKPKREKIYETKPWLLIYSTRQLNSPQIYLKSSDAQKDKASVYLLLMILCLFAMVGTYLFRLKKAIKKEEGRVKDDTILKLLDPE